MSFRQWHWMKLAVMWHHSCSEWCSQVRRLTILAQNCNAPGPTLQSIQEKGWLDFAISKKY